MPDLPSYPVDGSGWEYTQGACDVWELAALCNHFAGNRWEVVAVVPTHRGVQLPANLRRPNGPQRRGYALLPYEVLFRRPIVAEAEDA